MREQCDVDGCDKPRKCNNSTWCDMHYYRNYRYGTLELTRNYAPVKVTWDWMLKHTKEDKKTGCINWTKGKSQGYGIVSGHDRTHRLSWRLNYGDIPNGLHVLHHCDNKACVNPNHLFVGTHRDNIRDMVKKKLHAFGEKNGHAKLTDGQVRSIKKSNKRQCDLARQYNVTASCIHCIVRGKKWSHIK